MSTGKQNAVHAQQNSDGTFELHVEPSEGGEYDFGAEVSLEPPPSTRRRKIPFPLIGGLVFGALALGGIAYVVFDQASSQIDTEIALEPVAGFKPYMTGAGAPAVKPRTRASIPEPEEEVEESQEIREAESPSAEPVIEAEPEEQIEPLPPPPVLMRKPEVIEESEIAPEEAGWQVDEPEAAPDEQSNLLLRGPRKTRLEEFRNASALAQPKVPFEELGRGRRVVSARSMDPLKIGSRGLRRGGDASGSSDVEILPEQE